MPLIVDQHRTQLAESGNLAQTIHTTAQLATGASEYVLLVAPGNLDCRVTGAVYQAYGGTAQVILYKNPIVSANGTAKTKVFYDLTKNSTPELGVYTGPTISDKGSAFGSFKLFGTTASAGVATSSVSQTAVRKLEPKSLYLIELKAIGNNIEIQLFLEWAEL